MKTSALISAALLLGTFSAAAEAPARLPGLVYHPEGDAIVIENGTRWDNRPLYGHERFAILLSGEQPGVTGPMGRLHTLIARGDTRLALHQFQQRTARYRAGRMEWEVSDARLPGLTARLIITTLANADGCTARLIAEGVRPGDLAGWALAPPGVEKGSQYQVKTAANGFTLDRVPAAKLAQIAGRFSSPVTRWEQGGWKNHDVPAGLAALGAEPLKDASLIAWVPLADRKPQFAAVVTDDNDPRNWATLVRREPKSYMHPHSQDFGNYCRDLL